MRSWSLWLIAFLAVNGACTGGTSSTTPSPPTSTTLSVALTTTLASTTTTTPPETTTTLALPEEPRVSGGWSLQQGDYLVSNAQGVVVVRDGVNVAQPVTSPVESALAEGTGAIIFVTPDPELFPRHWPARGQGGGYTIWRVQPDGTLTPVLRTDFTIDGPLGAITLYQAPMIGVITDGFTTPILKVARSDSRENVVLAPAGNFNGVFGGLAMRLVGVITGVGWQESASRLIVSFNSDGGGWLEAWNFDDTPPVHWPSEWPTNPVPPDTPCPDDDGFNHCLGSVTTLPGTTLIAYTETDAWRTATSLIIYDTEAGKELTRVLVAEEPTFVKQLHASDTEVAVSLATYRDLRYQYLPTIVIEVGTGEQRSLPAGGVTTIVP